MKLVPRGGADAQGGLIEGGTLLFLGNLSLRIRTA